MLTGIFRELLKELISRTLSSPGGIDALRFRAANEDYLDYLDKLEESPYIEKVDGKYKLTLLALSEFDNDDAKVESILYRCGHLFSVLRRMYKESPGVQIKLDQFVQEVDLPENQVRKGLVYLTNAPIWGGYTNDLLNSKEVILKPGESILKYKTFQDVIKQLKEWAEKSLFRSPVLTDNDKDRPLYLREIDFNGAPSSTSIPAWHKNLNPIIKSLMEEVYFGLQKEMRALPSMGLRSVIDVVCNDLIGDVGGFTQKLEQLEERKHITPKHKALLETALNVGHATIHRGHFPELKELRIVLDIINHLLKEVYVLTPQSEDLKKTTPKRKKRNEIKI